MCHDWEVPNNPDCSLQRHLNLWKDPIVARTAQKPAWNVGYTKPVGPTSFGFTIVEVKALPSATLSSSISTLVTTSATASSVRSFAILRSNESFSARSFSSFSSIASSSPSIISISSSAPTQTSVKPTSGGPEPSSGLIGSSLISSTASYSQAATTRSISPTISPSIKDISSSSSWYFTLVLQSPTTGSVSSESLDVSITGYSTYTHDTLSSDSQISTRIPSPSPMASSIQHITSVVTVQVTPVPIRSSLSSGSLNSNASPSVKPSLVSATSSHTSSTTPGPALIGAIVGAVVAILILITVMFCCLRVRNRRHSKKYTPAPDTPPQIPAFSTWPSRRNSAPVPYAYLQRPSEPIIKSNSQGPSQVLGTSLLSDPFSSSVSTRAAAKLPCRPAPTHMRAPPPLVTSPFLDQFNFFGAVPQSSSPPPHLKPPPRPLRPPDTSQPIFHITPPPRNPRRLLSPSTPSHYQSQPQPPSSSNSHHFWTPKTISRHHDPTLTPRLPTPSPGNMSGAWRAHPSESWMRGGGGSATIAAVAPGTVLLVPPGSAGSLASRGGWSSSSSQLEPPWRTSPARFSRRSDPFDLEEV